MSTLDALYDAVFDELLTLGPEGCKSFSVVTDFAGELTQELLQQATLGRYPAALVAIAGEDPASASVDTTTGDDMDITRTAFVVYVAALAFRGDRHGEKGLANVSKGLFALVSEVLSVLNGLLIDGLWGTGRLHYAGMRPQLIRRGAVYVYALRFWADRLTEQAPIPEEGTQPFNAMDAGVNLTDTSPTEEPAANPLARAGGPIP